MYTLCILLALAQAVAAPDSSVQVTWGVRIPMRDGVTLNATVYGPAATTAPLPVVFELTPYNSDTYHERGMYFARHGYRFAIIDVRGRGNSGGAAHFMADAHDGYDIVEWLARQSWCDGKVAMWGGSYAGEDQWATAKEHPPHLATIVPAAAAYPSVDFPFFANIFDSYDTQWLTLVSGVTPQDHLFGEGSYWMDRFHAMYAHHLAFASLDSVIGNREPTFHEWLAHPIPDAHWDSLVPTPDQYTGIRIPVLTITGHYDGDQRGALEYYRRHMQSGATDHYLIIGPWDHAGTRTPRDEVGGLKFGPASLVDLPALHVAWYDWTMKGGPKPEFLKKKVAYYLPGKGAEVWKYADSIGGIGARPETLFLGGHSVDAFSSGSLGGQKSSGSDHWTYDPLDTRPGDELEREEVDNSTTDQRYALNLYGAGVVYHTAPFSDATEITGWLHLSLWLAMDVPDADISVNVYEIEPDGRSIALTDARMRARYRESPRHQVLVKPGEIQRYDFNNFQFFSRQIGKGSRLRLVISSPNSIQTEKNYNSGGVVANETGKDARAAHITLYHDTDHPSTLEIPVVRSQPVTQ
ncbi:MAG TPA: CocE/NonD family hydrolase [Gemmatimonadaceae bacterium]|nr:CocE/NonD family hydrolase [Gemmatimonadaceae bacterium]